MTRKTVVRSAIVVVALTAMVAGGAISAGAGNDPGRGRWDGRNQLVGTWTVTVNRPPPQPPLYGLQVYTDDGSLIEMASESQATRTASYGAWERIEGRMYASTMVFFRFNAQGEFVGSQKINRTIELGLDGNTFRAVARVTTLDVHGNVLASFVARSGGERMPVERIPDQP